MATNTDKDLKELRSELATLRSDFSEISKTLKRISGERYAEGRDKVNQGIERGRQQARDSLGEFEREIEARPLTSVAAAFGVGFVLGKLLDR